MCRRKRGMTQTDLQVQCAKVGVRMSRPVIAKIENATRAVSDYELRALARALRTDVRCLLAGPPHVPRLPGRQPWKRRPRAR